jgi:hypothetical protein
MFRSALFWDVTQHRVVIFTDVSGQRIGPIFKAQEVQVVFLDFPTLEDRTENLSRNVGKGLPLDAA